MVTFAPANGSLITTPDSPVRVDPRGIEGLTERNGGASLKFGILALDYDGTIARDGIVDSNVRTSIAKARARGIVVILVTGRILSDLKQVAGDLQFVDAVVAENGAVLAFPNGHSRLIGRPPSPVFIDELRRRAIDFAAGQCIVETDATLAPQILAVIRELELPLVLLFNRNRLMVLPQAISKATGVRTALTALRLSAHNAIAIGDAENDQDLLAACEIGVAVGWEVRLSRGMRTRLYTETVRTPLAHTFCRLQRVCGCLPIGLVERKSYSARWTVAGKPDWRSAVATSSSRETHDPESPGSRGSSVNS